MSEQSDTEKAKVRAGSTSQCIVCERAGTWATALGRALDRLEIVPRQTRSIEACEQELLKAPASFLAIELTMVNLAEVLGFLARFARYDPRARAIVLADRAMQPYEWLAREAGALQFATSPRRLDRTAEMIFRHLVRAPRRSTNLTERIWAALPWSS